MSIDWGDTGTWMQAWAGFAQAGAIGFAAFKGAGAFKDWRRQKIEERRIDAAERILTLAYRVRRAIGAMRHPMMWIGPLNEAEQKLRSKGVDLDSEVEARRRRIIHSQAVFDRINSFQTEWDELAAITPVAKALFGDEVENALSELGRQRNVVAAAAESYVDDDGSDAEFSKKIRSDLWEALGEVGKDTDEISKTITAAIGKLEGELLPSIRAE
jgi:hypothetical protein